MPLRIGFKLQKQKVTCSSEMRAEHFIKNVFKFVSRKFRFLMKRCNDNMPLITINWMSTNEPLKST
jgi:hypothetical protein